MHRCRIAVLCALFLAGLAVPPAPARGAEDVPAFPRRDSVQAVLSALYQERPDLVGFIPETQRWYLFVARAEAIPPLYYLHLQDAFLHDISALCQEYGYRYLADWHALASKAARETCWGTSYLCNRALNYFGIRNTAKPWLCESFYFCETLTRNDPDPSDFAVFPTFEASLWMFVHTMYNRHFLERLPDQGARVAGAIEFERMNGIRYWEHTRYGIRYSPQLQGPLYTVEELTYTWSEHPINNLCVNCNRETDRDWANRLAQVYARHGSR
jgi:hypothetical protein